jgi:hypothetical protein
VVGKDDLRLEPLQLPQKGRLGLNALARAGKTALAKSMFDEGGVARLILDN